jgi:hypothetical protein
MKTKPVFLRSRILLFWVCSSDLSFKRLSHNILREVSTYLGNASLIIAAVQDRLFSFLPGKQIWEEYSSLRPILPAFSRSSYVFFKEDVLIIGGYDDNLCKTVSRTFRIQAGTVGRGPDMLAARCFSGCLQTAGNVYVFGGMDQDALSSCEKLNQKDWISLDNMKHSRFNFVPCEHQALVYICGGNSLAVEIFDPSTSLFSASTLLCGPSTTQWSCALISHEEKLVFMGYSWIQKGESIGRSRRGGFSWSSCSPVVVEGVVYFVDNRVAMTPICRGVRLEDGAQVCACPLSLHQS